VGDLLEEFPRFVVVTCDNIGSKLMQTVRLALRKIDSVLLMGKNTMMRKAIRDKLAQHPSWAPIIATIHHNCGLVLTKRPLAEVRALLIEHTVPAVAKIGSVAPDDVVLPKQVTTLEPTKTSFFAALDIATKITKGCVEILNPVKICEKGKKVGSSEAALLAMLDIRPFTYGLMITHCWDGSLFEVAFLDYTEEHLYRALASGISNLAALSLALNYPTIASFPHVVGAGFRNCAAIALATNYSFPQADSIKQRLENPGLYASAATTTTTTTASKATTATKEPVVETKEKSEEEEAEDAGGLMDFF